MRAIGSLVPHASPPRRPLPRRHKVMLLVAFEVLVLGFTLAACFPIRPAGIVVETTVTPNHVVT
ncbi:hypothetical protein ACFZ8E_18630 [Methylobacterium sp. HMF5984]|uniref:hypothetical protein n=1 Tax=unclassified Methylobacterium TaxID=2615210 RepID=UPI001FBB54BD|nr:hypothetical protein [Methylobacterium sp. J-092]MCJ2005653.1 hypothetical protein [Methylobacterium sp. J-092]MCJ2042817.1 hypothetical protein [Methylobacterium sp. J-059]